jgi:predicted amino acid-binding ACT domain protein
MLLLDFVRTTPSPRPSILLPRFHSGHLGFVPGTRVHVATPTVSSRRADMRTEVLVTPFQTTPDNAALVSVVLHDAVGVVQSLVKALSQLDVNIEVQESSSIDHLDLHRVGMIVDLGAENRALPDDTTSERVQDLYRDFAANVPIHSKRFLYLFDAIVAHCGDALWWHPYDGRRIPALYVRPLPRRAELNPSSVLLTASSDERHTQIRLPSEIAQHVRQRMAIAGRRPQELSYVFVSDTNDRTLRTFFLPEPLAQRLVHVGIHHTDMPGTLARVLDVVATAGFNIVTSLLRKYRRNTSVWEAILEYRSSDGLPPRPPQDRDQLPLWYREELLRWVHGKLAASPQLAQIAGCGVSIGPPLYPKASGGLDPKNRVRLSPSRPRPEDPPAPANGRLLELVEQRIDDLEKARTRPEYLDARGLLGTVARHRQRIRQRTLFLSYPSSAGKKFVDAYLRRALRPPEDPAYHLTQYQEPKPPEFQKQIIGLIRAADYFLAIWHPDEDDRGNYHSPVSISPWMYFEYGVARTLGKPLVVACHRALSEPERLVGNIGLIPYDDSDFATHAVPRIQEACAEIFEDHLEARYNDDPCDD